MPVFDITKISNNSESTKQPILNTPLPIPAAPDRPRCPNCDAVISCGCQFTQASDGKQVCDECVQSYESFLLDSENN